MKTTRRAFLGMAGAAALAAARRGATASAAAKPPNIIFILADDMGYGDLGCYGQEQVLTPRLDAMAAEGVRFTQCYAGSTVCAPSRCCLMTGMHTGHARIRGNDRVPLEPGDTTVAEVLRGAGYETALIGKWGLGDIGTTGTPTRKGFDHFFGFLDQQHAHNHYPDYLWENETRVELPENVQHETFEGVCAQCETFADDLFTEKALAFIEKDRNRPFFLYLSHVIPHANNERGAALGNGMQVPDFGPYADKPWPDPIKGHAAMITRLDSYVGRVLDTLRARGLDRDTIVLFTSDNGVHKEGGTDPNFFQSSGPLRGIKRSMHDGGIRVPMVAWGPGRVPAGVVSDQVWAFWDFLPTAAELAGAQALAGLDGVSVAAALTGAAKVDHPPLYWEFHEGGYFRAARMGDWKAVSLSPDEPTQLYKFPEDIGEANNIAADHPDIVAQVDAFMASARTPSEHWPGRAGKKKQK